MVLEKQASEKCAPLENKGKILKESDNVRRTTSLTMTYQYHVHVLLSK
jgi:hypothetical protein